jgi:hypothetical protein
MEQIRAMCPVCGHRYRTHSGLEGHTIPCPKCGELIPVERDWRGVLAPAAPSQAKKPTFQIEWSARDIIRKGILISLLGVALFLMLRGDGKVLVSFDNGLDVPVQIFLDGKPGRVLSPGEVRNQNLRSGYHSVVIQWVDGGVVEHKTIFCEKGYYIYNIADAHQYEIQYHMYVTPETRGKSRVVPPPQPLKKASFLPVDADIPLGIKPPEEIELPDGYEHFTLSAVSIVKPMEIKR